MLATGEFVLAFIVDVALTKVGEFARGVLLREVKLEAFPGAGPMTLFCLL